MDAARLRIRQEEAAGRSSGVSGSNTRGSEYDGALAAHPGLSVGQVEEGCIAHVFDPSCFYLHLASDQEKLTDIIMDMHRFYEKGQGASWTFIPPASMAAVKDQKDDLWYRAKILHLDRASNRMTVKYVDQGNIETVTCDKQTVRQLHCNFLTQNVLTVECALFGMGKTQWTQEESSMFKQFLENHSGSVTAVGVGPAEGRKCLVELRSSGQNLNHLFRRQFGLRPIPPLPGQLPLPAAFANMPSRELSDRVQGASGGRASLPQSSQAAVGPKYTSLDTKELLFKQKEVMVTHVKSPAHFYVSVIDPEMEDRLIRIQEDMTRFYAQLTPSNEMRLTGAEKGYPCAVRYNKDGKWYRAIVTDSKLLPGTSLIRVRLVDYGNEENVSLQNMKQLRDVDLGLPAQAILCSLQDASPVPPSTIWSPEAVKCMEELYGKIVRCVFHKVADDGTLVVELLTRHVAAPNIPISILEAMRKSGLAASETAHTLIPFSRIPLKEGIRVPEAVGSFVESVQNFSLHMSTYLTKLRTINELLLDYGKKHDQQVQVPAPPGSRCVARFRADGLWYRAEILSDVPGPELAHRVLFVDYGHSGICSKQDLFVVEGKVLVETPCLAISCTLNNAEADMDKKLQEFKDLLAEGVTARIISVGDSNIYTVDLTLSDGRTVTDLLRIGSRPSIPAEEASKSEEAEGSTPSVLSLAGVPDLPIPGEISDFVDVVVSHVTGKDEVFVQLQNEIGSILKLCELMKSEFSDKKPTLLINPRKGELCAAQYAEDTLWYRAVVLERPDSRNVKVYFIDYGNTELVPKESIMKIENEKLLTMPPQAIRCRLTDIPPDGNVAKLKSFLLSKNVTIKLVSQIGDVYEVLMDYNVGSQTHSVNEVVAGKKEIPSDPKESSQSVRRDGFGPAHQPQEDRRGTFGRGDTGTRFGGATGEGRDGERSFHQIGDGFGRSQSSGFSFGGEQRGRGERNGRGGRGGGGFRGNRGSRFGDSGDGPGFFNSGRGVNRGFGSSRGVPRDGVMEQQRTFGGAGFGDRNRGGSFGGAFGNFGGGEMRGGRGNFFGAKGSTGRGGGRFFATNSSYTGAEAVEEKRDSLPVAVVKEDLKTQAASVPTEEEKVSQEDKADLSPDKEQEEKDTMTSRSVIMYQDVPVTVQFADYGPKKFFLSLASWATILDAVDNAIDTVGREKPMTTAEPGKKGLADYEGSLYRCSVEEVTGDAVKVFFMDFGNTETLTLDEMYSIPDGSADILRTPPLAVQCSLDGVEPSEGTKWSAEAVDEFADKLSSASAVSARFLRKDPETGVYSVILTISEEGSVADFLTKGGFGRKTEQEAEVASGNGSEESETKIREAQGENEPTGAGEIDRSFPLDEDLSVTVQFADSGPGKLFLSLSRWESILDAVDKAIDTVGREKPMTTAEPGKKGLADYEGSLYRCSVEEVTGGTVKVFFMDFGNTETLTLDKMYSIPDGSADILRTPPLAVQCSLEGVEPSEGTEWSAEAVDEFADKLSSASAVSARFLRKDPETGVYSVTLTISEEGSVADFLTKGGFGRKTELETEIDMNIPPDVGKEQSNESVEGEEEEEHNKQFHAEPVVPSVEKETTDAPGCDTEEQKTVRDDSGNSLDVPTTDATVTSEMEPPKEEEIDVGQSMEKTEGVTEKQETEAERDAAAEKQETGDECLNGSSDDQFADASESDSETEMVAAKPTTSAQTFQAKIVVAALDSETSEKHCFGEPASEKRGKELTTPKMSDSKDVDKEGTTEKMDSE